MSYSSQKSCVKIWFGLVKSFKSYHLNFPGGQKPRIREVTCGLWCPFSNLAEVFQSKVMCENLVWIGKAFQELSCPQTFFWGGGGRSPLVGATCDLWWPFSNLDEIFQSKVMRENLVQIRWAFQELSFEFSEGQKPSIRGLHVTCNASFRTWLSYLSQKSCVKIWFRLVEPFKSYRVHKYFSRGRHPLLGVGYILLVIPIFKLVWAIPVKSHVLKCGLDWLKLEVC